MNAAKKRFKEAEALVEERLENRQAAGVYHALMMLKAARNEVKLVGERNLENLQRMQQDLEDNRTFPTNPANYRCWEDMGGAVAKLKAMWEQLALVLNTVDDTGLKAEVFAILERNN